MLWARRGHQTEARTKAIPRRRNGLCLKMFSDLELHVQPNMVQASPLKEPFQNLPPLSSLYYLELRGSED